ncbi:MAG: hypothetical protein L0191_18815 [Acidobacteria bacterium]|nr:hypothetical protein [Acidobacteriota bacterium]
MRAFLSWVAVSLALLVVTLGGWVGGEQHDGEESDLEGFLAQHWDPPIPSQGTPPPGFSPLEASIAPKHCGVCHRPQYDDWKMSLHSRSMGPGVRGQTMELIEEDPATALRCYDCHAPLTEQQEKIRGPHSTAARFRRNMGFQAALQGEGLSCAGCHVRHHQRYGPPKRDGTLENSLPASQLPHRGAIRTPAFERAEFCKGCHQFGPDGYALNGKLMENTYEEWRAWAGLGERPTCQGCHMPNRQHLWRGIHDPATVKQGVTVQLALGRERYRVGDELRATMMLANTGVGHYFPTYVTPKVLVRFELLDAKGRRIPGSFHEERIGREVTLDLARELFDTRIPPGKSHTVRYVRRIDRSGLKVKASVTVSPDDFYEKFFEATTRKARTRSARAMLRRALDQARRSSFAIFEEELNVS